MENNEKLLQAFQADKCTEYLDCFIEQLRDALHLFEALQDELDSPTPKADRCLSFMRSGVSSCSALDELECLLHFIENAL
jgi:hypothetical protein